MREQAAVVLMGVAGCGKSTVGRALAEALDAPFFDADDFHSSASIAKMRAGVALTDADRAPWLERLNALLHEHPRVVLACSALRAAYRERLARGLPRVRFVYLRGARTLVAERLAARQGHYMPAALLDSQFATLEEPVDAIVLDIDRSPAELVAGALAALAAHCGTPPANPRRRP